MKSYILFNDDVPVARFAVNNGIVISFSANKPWLLPMQLKNASSDRFMMWLSNRAIDLNVVQHRNLVHRLYGSRDKLTLALATHMYSISDTFTCFEENEFIKRQSLCNTDVQNEIADFILISSDTSLQNAAFATPNVSTDGSFMKTWSNIDGKWWLYKTQSEAAARSEIEISSVLRSAGWDSAVYEPDPRSPNRDRSLNFLFDNEFFEPYDSLRFMFDDLSDDDNIIDANISSLGKAFEVQWKRIKASDAFFANSDRHMRNFGVIRSSVTGEILRMAPNFDNNQAYLGNPSGRYSDTMLRYFLSSAENDDVSNLIHLIEHTSANSFLHEAYEAGIRLLKK